MKYALVNSAGIISNIIVYVPGHKDDVKVGEDSNGDPIFEKREYEAPVGLKVAQVNDWLGIGDHIDDELTPHPGTFNQD